MKEKNKVLVHFETKKVSIYKEQNKKIVKIKEDTLYFNETIINNELYNKIDQFLYELNNNNTLNATNLRLYATGIFQEFSFNEQMQLIIHVFVKHGVYFNIINKNLEQFYLNQEQNGKKVCNVIQGIWKQEFRKVVICGSFQKNMTEICQLMDKLNQHNIEILSPWTKDVVKETLGTDFILLEGQILENERDSWRHKYDHMNKFIKADAIIVCNPNGIIGKGTMFEFGFMTAFNKRIIFTNEPKDISIMFPYEIGLNNID